MSLHSNITDAKAIEAIADRTRPAGGGPRPDKPRRRRRLTPSTVIASIALFAAVGGGTATAAKLITGKDIARSAITGKHVKDRSLTAADFRDSLAGPQGPAGPAGPTGPRGPVGATGDRGPVGEEGARGQEGPPGKQGERGLQGEPGKDGRDGIDGTDGENGKDGRNGIDGRNGTDGRDGRNGFGSIEIVQQVWDIDKNGVWEKIVPCPPSHPRVVSGGVNAHVPDPPENPNNWANWGKARVVLSYPQDTSGWTMWVHNTDAQRTLRAVAYAICVNG